MDIFQIIIIGIAVPGIVQCILKFLSCKKNILKNEVYMPRFFEILGIICAFADLLVFIVSLFTPLTPIIIIISAVVAGISVISLCLFYSMRIFYNAEKIVVSRFFKKTTYFYRDIKGVLPGSGNGYTLIFTNGKLRVDGLAVNGQQFLFYSEEQFKKTTGSYAIPDVKPKLFNGNVREPWQFVFLFCLIGIAILLLPIIATVDFLFTKNSPESLIETQIVADSLIERDSILLISSDTTTYYVSYDAISNIEILLESVERKKPLQVLHISVPVEQNNKQDVSIWGLSDENGLIFTTPEIIHKLKTTQSIRQLAFLWVIAFIWWLFTLICFYFLKHAQKYPRIASLLVKEEYRNF